MSPDKKSLPPFKCKKCKRDKWYTTYDCPDADGSECRLCAGCGWREPTDYYDCVEGLTTTWTSTVDKDGNIVPLKAWDGGEDKPLKFKCTACWTEPDDWRRARLGAAYKELDEASAAAHKAFYGLGVPGMVAPPDPTVQASASTVHPWRCLDCRKTYATPDVNPATGDEFCPHCKYHLNHVPPRGYTTAPAQPQYICIAGHTVSLGSSYSALVDLEQGPNTPSVRMDYCCTCYDTGRVLSPIFKRTSALGGLGAPPPPGKPADDAQLILEEVTVRLMELVKRKGSMQDAVLTLLDEYDISKKERKK